MMHNVVVTGYGVISPYGVGVDRLMGGLREQTSAVRSMAAEWQGLAQGMVCMLGAPVPEAIDVASIPRKNRRGMGRAAMLAQLAVREAVQHAALSPDLLRSGRAGAVVGDTIPSAGSLEGFYRHYLMERDIRQVPAGGFFRVMGHSCSANIAACLGLRGRVLATPAACAAGAFAVGTGMELVRWGVQDVVLCGGVEELHPTTSAIFDIVGASSSHWNDAPERSPAPFDKNRDGTVCGEGAGFLVLESEQHAEQREARILARVLGFGGVADGSNMAQPGLESMVRCFKSALQDAALSPQEIDYVNAHATATTHGDRAEATAIAQVFGDAVPVSGLKGYIGHTLGASGTIESIAGLEMMAGGYIIPTGKLQQVDPECAMVRHQLALESRRIDRFVKSSFGFGGMNAVLVFGRYDNGSG
jgi:3-oxoacyl-[acyl-carrier-protein] synthase II